MTSIIIVGIAVLAILSFGTTSTSLACLLMIFYCSGNRLLLNSMILFCLVYSEISLLVAQSFGILQISINGSAALPIIQLDSSAFYIGLDYDYGYDNNACTKP